MLLPCYCDALGSLSLPWLFALLAPLPFPSLLLPNYLCQAGLHENQKTAAGPACEQGPAGPGCKQRPSAPCPLRRARGGGAAAVLPALAVAPASKAAAPTLPSSMLAAGWLCPALSQRAPATWHMT